MEDPSEFKTRKTLIDKNLRKAGWIENKDWVNEYRLEGMPNTKSVGFADYVLFGDDGRPLAVIEAKRTSVDPSAGRIQAALYADLLEERFKRRPVIFLTNGYEYYITDNLGYPERRISGIYSKQDLVKLFNLAANREKKLSDAIINNNITDRYYQKSAIKATCTAFENKRRKALLVMATGSGKTRTIISLIDVLLRKGWVRNVLFLADRTSLVSQAASSFNALLPELSISNLCKSDGDTHARCVLSTYQTMSNLIDSAIEKDNTRTFSVGHFDLIVLDEAHRSIYNKYKEIFNHFDSLLVGLTATPKDDIDKNTYAMFDLENGIPTYGYELAQAVTDGHLVDYKSIEVKTKFLERGIIYDELSEEEKEEYEKLFLSEGEAIPGEISKDKLYRWLFTRNTVEKVLDSLMRMGLKTDDGSRIGKTIIFAKNHRHAEYIREIFGKQYPDRTGECEVIDNYINYADTEIDKFRKRDSKVRIAVSVDMLDTGIDIPDILNLVFFKPVYSKTKFWQMIGRGTRLCPGLIDGNDKNIFYIFDFCGNFEFFSVERKEIKTSGMASIQGKIVVFKANLARLLQNIKYQTEPYMSFRKELVSDIKKKIDELNHENYAVAQHLRAVDKYSNLDCLNSLTADDIAEIENELARLILPYGEDPSAVRMDAIMLRIELNHILGSINTPYFNRVLMWATKLSEQTVIPDVAAHIDIIRAVLFEKALENGNIEFYERVREELRDLLKYIEKTVFSPCDGNFIDEILEVNVNDSKPETTVLESYREKAEHYVRTHENEDVIRKLKTNLPLDDADIAKLEEILWSEIGTIDEYKAAFGNKPLPLFIREITGLDMNAAKETFSKYLDEVQLNDSQIYFVNQIIEYVVHNGVISDISILRDAPFNNYGSFSKLFEDQNVWNKIRYAINDINVNGGIRQVSS